ncbi:putative ATP-binding cassette transporter [Chitinophaga sp. CF118]|uniref:cyclic peptide export ABC transporter n=1 Tax=Chitinophaga sp. CF118 TaxID=1884367 RepID=UPI0008E00811|nr:cyclic peptide export ABC transporter [Chitinophaga sp. CF118]SFF10347.1 putative ATP-binding cassette transporter [Chitinophaga sp. CF118]
MKQLLRILLPQIGRGTLLSYVLLAIFTGLCSFLFINTVTRVIGLTIGGSITNISQEYFIIFASIIVVFIWVRRTLSLAIIKLSQKLFWRFRMQIITQVLKANYQQLSARKTEIQAAIVNDVNTLTNASLTIIDFFASFILALSCLIYLASISWQLFSITLIVALSGAAMYHFNSKRNLNFFGKARKLETEFQENYNAIIDGFKEIYMEPRKGAVIYDTKISTIAGSAYHNNLTAFTGYLNNQITGQVLFYSLLASVLLFLAAAFQLKPGDMVSFVFTLLYLLGAIEKIMMLLPGIMNAGVAADHLMALKKELEESNFDHPIPQQYISRDEFQQITISNLEYNYGKSFGIGPVNINISKGDVIFIYGGNGSGKTTLIHTILGLRLPSAGGIRLNRTLVDKDNYPEYRTLFAVVFSDFYLFNQVMGADEIDTEKWDYYVRLFELENKVSINGNNLSTTDLSTGQRKRLALIMALLEKKPILAIDEWAADQDPYFRKKFYTEIIPLLKEEGITIIAITHDDKYYHCADKLYKMNDGKLIEEQVDQPALI